MLAGRPKSVQVRVTGVLALLGALGAALQAGLFLVRGKAICINEGCRVVEADPARRS
jgi:hypothetical protein